MDTHHWPAATDRDAYAEPFLAHTDAIADAARAGRWNDVFATLDADKDAGHPNVWRIGGNSGFTPLHQAAWHGAPAEVVHELLRRGAWRALRTADGRTAADIARERGHEQLAREIEPQPGERTLQYSVLDGHLMGLIEARVRPALSIRLRYPQTAVVHEVGKLWYPVPGMYGGFALKAIPDGVEAESWIRVVGGSGQRHVITREGCRLVEEGFV
ncbi:hypothetical protein ACFQHV_23840 [Promicromonospora thailandica]|uniref:Ankyrin repeat-containing protein n=1 Tax=Promicromonospora thailandica TaxID=765201 RepID=A0A9X2G1V3_9MICO|nr:ankyrin repeat domain-containing protein [Promicromonospora thailandica]MCP2264380.1 Ankyrin repeat-containing protein [Promicromonospora thailandica]BFF20926.1 ankyrin repeat domain-containing protein [Promicromonospora thailandica]